MELGIWLVMCTMVKSGRMLWAGYVLVYLYIMHGRYATMSQVQITFVVQ